MDVFSSLFGGGGGGEEEEKIVKGDDVIVDLEATLEDLYMGGSLKVRNKYSLVICIFTCLVLYGMLYILLCHGSSLHYPCEAKSLSSMLGLEGEERHKASTWKETL